MVASFLSDKDYKDPSQFVPSAKNTITVPFKVSERYPEFKKLVKKAEKWWKDHVETGISPAFDEKADAEILKELRTNTLNPEDVYKRQGYKGVWWDAHRQMWVAYISVHGKRIHLGRYHRLEDAVKARQRGEDEYFLPLIERKAAEEVAG